MCGLFGLWDPGVAPEARVAVAAAAAELLAHRGPDDRGFHHDAELPLALAFTRLAIQGLGAQGAQPMHDADGRGVLVFNGELFSAAPLRQELVQEGARFRGSSDTEILLHALCRWGLTTTLRRIEGQYAFLWLDRARRELHLARDPMGIRPLYYAADGPRLALASEQKALLALPWVDRAPVTAALLRFLVLGRSDDVPGETMVAGIKLLPPGYTARWDGRTLALERFHRIEEPTQPSDVAAVRRALDRAVSAQLVGDVPLGATVSGGLDSSTVTLLADRARAAAGVREPLHLFAFHDQRAEADERSYQRQVMAAMQSPHEVHWVSGSPRELAENFDHYLFHQEEPYGDASSYAEMCLARAAAAAGVKVLLSGIGGDEVFAGYPIFFGPLIVDALRALDVETLRTIVRVAPSVTPGTLGVRPLVMAAYQSLPAPLRNAVAALRGARRGALPWRNLPATLSDAARRWHAHDGRQATNAALRGAIESWCIPRYLLHSDRMTLAYGVEGRVPLLDLGVVKAAFALPAAARVDARGLKAGLRAAVADVLPEAVTKRAWKLGFHAPLGAYVEALDDRLRAGHAHVGALLGHAPRWERLAPATRWLWGNLGCYLAWVAARPTVTAA